MKNRILAIAITMIMIMALCLAGCMGTSEEGSQMSAEVVETEPEQQDEVLPAEDTDMPETEEKEADIQEEQKETEEAEEEPESEEEPAEKHVRLRLDDSGQDVFALWGSGKPDYRYGPSMMIREDGGIDAWFASPGDGKKEYDWITYRHSDDGITWGNEKVVLSPTPGTADLKSVCDPDVFFHDGYYYMGYTATVNEDGLCNNVFLARSKNPDGPYEKWGKDGWGSDPVPIIYFDGIDIGWGVGEPSFVLVDDTLYVYNTLDSFSDVYGWVRATQVHTTDITDPMWPDKLEYRGITAYRNDCTDNTGYTYADSDSWSVAYLEDSGKFIALTTNRRFKDDSCLLYYESDDGISFERVSELNTNVITGCHNCGLMSDERGHIGKDDRSLIGYAYAGSGNSKWGVWATRFVPVCIDYTDEIDRGEDGAENLKQKIFIDESLLGEGPIMLMTDQLTYTTYVGAASVPIRFFLMDKYRRKSLLQEKVYVEKYDHNILEMNEDGELVPLREGVTTVGLEYNGLRRDICVRVLPEDCSGTKIKKFYPVCDRYDISVDERIILQVRPMAVFDNYDIHELSGYEIVANDIAFRSSDPSVCIIEKDGKITPVSAGTSVITVEGTGCRYTIDVYVTD